MMNDKTPTPEMVILNGLEAAKAAFGDNALSKLHGGDGISAGYRRAVVKEVDKALKTLRQAKIVVTHLDAIKYDKAIRDPVVVLPKASDARNDGVKFAAIFNAALGACSAALEAAGVPWREGES